MALILAALPASSDPHVQRWPGEEVVVTTPIGPQRLFVRRGGTPGCAPMVFIHGLGGSATNWTDLMAALAPSIDGHAIDLPGHGFSGPSPSGKYRPSDHIAAILAYLDVVLPGQAVHLVGNSMGGLVSTLFAARHPERVLTLTLVSPALPDVRPVVMASRTPLLAASFFGPILLKSMQKGSPRERATRLLGLCYAEPSRIRPARVEEVVEDYKARADHEWAQPAFLDSLRGIVASTFARGDRDVWAQARTIEAPVLWIHGKADRLVHWGLVRRGARSFKHCSTLIVEDSGHVTQMEHPELTARAILAHMKKAPSSAAWTACG